GKRPAWTFSRKRISAPLPTEASPEVADDPQDDGHGPAEGHAGDRGTGRGFELRLRVGSTNTHSGVRDCRSDRNYEAFMKTLVPVVIAALTLTLAAASTALGVGCPKWGCNENGTSLNGIWSN